MRRFLLLLTLLLPFLMLASAASLRAQPALAPPRDPAALAFRVVGLEDRPATEAEVARVAGEARRRLLRRTTYDWQGTVEIRWLDERAFLEATNFRPEHTAAAADMRRGLVLLNTAGWNRAAPAERLATLTHEFAHILVGSLHGGLSLPLWTHEGLAMILANQWTAEDYIALLQAHSVGALPHLAQIEYEFPAEGPTRQQAYRTSHMAVATLARLQGDQPGRVDVLLARIADPRHGVDFGNSLFDPLRREEILLAMSRDLGSRWTTGVIAVTGGGALLLIASILVIVAYLKVRARNAQRAAEEREDEPWAASLTDADIQDLYGDREERWQSDDDEDDVNAPTRRR
jgi:hypothetical protein